MADFKPTESQLAAITTRGCPVLVSAGAGSGKTRVLTERLMACITAPDNSVDIDSFLIITYTRAAAGELRGRIAEQLAERLAAQPDDLRLRRQSALIRRAQIGTIHSFCADLLRENCQAAGLAPDFAILDEERAEAMRAAALDRVLESCYAGMEQHPDFRLLADSVGEGRDDSALAALILDLHTKMQCHAFPQRWAEQQTRLLSETHADAGETLWGRELLAWTRGLADYWAEEMDLLLVRMEAEPKIRAAYGEAFAGLGEQLRELSRCLDIGWDRAAAMLPLRPPSLKPLRSSPDPALSDFLKKRRTVCLESMKKAAQVFSSASSELLADLAATAPAMKELLRVTLAFDSEYQKEKQSRGLVDYSDLEHRAAELLTGPDGAPTELAERLSRRYTEIMVDEYQDVSRVQDAIFHAVSDGGRKLFLVGDVKQSIYRFRLADPEIFQEKYRNYAKPGAGAARILLRENFRSRAEVLDACNAVFSRCMSPKLGDVEYGEEAALVCGARWYEGSGVRPEMLLCALPKEDGGNTAVREAQEAAFTARQIRALVESGARVSGPDGPRPMTYGDVAILLRSPNKTGGVYRRALMAEGIPVGQAQGSGFFNSIEVSLVLSMLSVMDNPHKDIPLIAVLRSAAFNFSPDELSGVRAADRNADFYTALQAAAAEEEKCRHFLEELSVLRTRAMDLSAQETVWLVIDSLDLLALCSAMDDGERRRKNLMALAELSGKFESTGYRGLHRFCLWLKTLAEKGREPAVWGGSEAAVEIVSIHRSKGLEYPVVFLCDAGRRFNMHERSAPVLVHPELGLGPKVVDRGKRVCYPSLARLAIAKRLEREELSEQMRLLYVAMTRAKERLYVVAGYREPEKELEKAAQLAAGPLAPELLLRAGSFADWLLPACIADGEEHFAVKVCIPETEGEKARTAAEPAAPDPEAGAELRRRLAFRYPFPAAVELPSKVTATEFKGTESPESEAAPMVRQVGSVFRMPVLGQGERGLTAAERGTATHLLLQHIDFAAAGSRKGIRSEIERLLAKGFLTPRQAQAVNVSAVERLFRSALGKRMRAAAAPLREFRFSLLLDAGKFYPGAEGEELLLQGVVDCCLEEADGLVVIDYKTDRVRAGEDIAAHAERYRGQISAYAAALSRIFGKPVREAVLFFLSTGTACRLL